MAEEEDKTAEEEKKEGEEGAEGAEAGEKKGLSGLMSGKKKFIVIGVVALVLVLGGGAGLYFSGIIGGKEEMSTEEAQAAAEAARKAQENASAVFYDLGDILVNLSGDGKRPNYLKIKVSLELGSAKDIPLMDQIRPRILDNFQIYLRELRIDDLKGSAGIYRLREELLMRVTEAAHPARVRDVLFQEMLVQ
ncbi:MAG: flagellar basal body protein FliL [Alphaproteobacteria bacterium]|nr:flagellar basal body protein FliL [Alphaproteobacteria bacterium]